MTFRIHNRSSSFSPTRSSLFYSLIRSSPFIRIRTHTYTLLTLLHYLRRFCPIFHFCSPSPRPCIVPLFFFNTVHLHRVLKLVAVFFRRPSFRYERPYHPFSLIANYVRHNGRITVMEMSLPFSRVPLFSAPYFSPRTIPLLGKANAPRRTRPRA